MVRVVSRSVVLLLAFATSPAAQGDGSTALHWAAYRDDLAAVDKLIRGGADVNASNDLGATPLWAASQNGSAPVVRRLLDAGANPNAALLGGETPLMVAARSGYPAVVSQLIAKGASLNARGPRGQTALMWAVSQRHSETVDVLLQHHADVHLRSEEWSQMMAVPPHGLPEYNRMIPHGGDTALMFAARVGDVASARMLVAAGANVNDEDAWGVSATGMAAFAGHGDIARLLLEKGADPNAARAGFTPLHSAIMRRDEKTVEALLSRGADPNAPVRVWTPTRRSSDDYYFQPALVGATPFWLAARFIQPNVMRLIAKHGGNPRVVHRSEYAAGESYKKRTETTTALAAALGMGGGTAWVLPDTSEREALTLEAVKLALDFGVDVNAANADGRTALDAAKILKYPSVMRLLVENGARETAVLR